MHVYIKYSQAHGLDITSTSTNKRWNGEENVYVWLKLACVR